MLREKPPKSLDNKMKMPLSFLHFPLSVLQESWTGPQISHSTLFNQIWHLHAPLRACAHFAWLVEPSPCPICSMEASEIFFQIYTNIENHHYAPIHVSHGFQNNRFVHQSVSSQHNDVSFFICPESILLAAGCPEPLHLPQYSTLVVSIPSTHIFA